MIPRLDEAFYVKDYTLHVRFIDGTEGNVDLEKELHGEIFQPLKDVDFFKTFRVDRELHAIVWPNGADFAPEFLYQQIQVHTHR